MSGKIRVAVLLGGQSAEHEVSLNSGTKVANALDRERYEILPVKIEKNGQWLIGSDLIDELITDVENHFDGALIASPGSAVEMLIQEGVDVVFLALHGKNGEDGKMQGVFELAGIPYTGSGVAASALAMDKVRTNHIYAHHGLLVPKFIYFTIKEWRENRNAWLAETQHIAMPIVIKPTADGSSVGTYIISDSEAVAEAVDLAFEVCDSVMIQEYIKGDEVTCSVLEIDGELQALAPTLIRPVSSEFFDYEAKYTPGATEEITPAPLSDHIIKKIQAIGLSAHMLLGCSSYSRTDMIVHGEDVYVLETNTLPGMTNTSLVPQAAQHAGIEFHKLIEIIIANALQ